MSWLRPGIKPPVLPHACRLPVGFVFPSLLLALPETVQHLHHPHLAPNLLTSTLAATPVARGSTRQPSPAGPANNVKVSCRARLQSTHTDKQFGPSSHLETQDDPGFAPRILPVSAGDRTGFRTPKAPCSLLTLRCLGWEPDHTRPRALA